MKMYRRCPVCSSPVKPAGFFKPAFSTEAGPIICTQCNCAISRPWRELGKGVTLGSASGILLVSLYDSEPFGLTGITGLMIFSAFAACLYLLMVGALTYYAFPLSPIRNNPTHKRLLTIRPLQLVHLVSIVLVAVALQSLFNTYLTTLFFAIGFALSEVLSINRNGRLTRLLPIGCYVVGLLLVPWDNVGNFFNGAEKSKQFCGQLQPGTMRSEVMQNAQIAGLTYAEKTPYLLAAISHGDGPTNCYVFYINSRVLRTEHRSRR